MIYILITVGLIASVLLLGRTFSGVIAGHVQVKTIDRRCSGSVNRWAKRRLEIYRQQLIEDHHRNQSQDDTNAATRAINWFDNLIIDRMLDKQRQEITRTTLSTSFCRPVFE